MGNNLKKKLKGYVDENTYISKWLKYMEYTNGYFD